MIDNTQLSLNFAGASSSSSTSRPRRKRLARRRMVAERRFRVALFLDDDSIVEGEITATSGEDAASMFLSEEAARRGVPYSALRDRILPGGALVGMP